MPKNKITNLEAATPLAGALSETVLESKRNDFFGAFQVRENKSDFNALNSDDKVKAIVDMLYKERNAFVHQGRLPQISDQRVKMLGYCNIKNKSTFVSIQI